MSRETLGLVSRLVCTISAQCVRAVSGNKERTVMVILLSCGFVRETWDHYGLSSLTW